jgi:pimeloyl-ACP methyl ester carboxylesterase
MRFLNNNDTGARFVDQHGPKVTKVAATMQFTLPGIPAMFAGDEIGASYEPYSNLTPIPWRDRHGLRSHYERLIELRHTLPALTSAGFVYTTGAKDIEAARPYIESIDLSDVADRITCPLMIVHGGADVITPTENMTLMRDRARGPVEVLFWEDSGHCVHDRAHIVRPGMADFMARHLAG